MKKRLIILSVIIMFLVIPLYFIMRNNKEHTYGTTVGNMYNRKGVAVKVDDSLYLTWESSLYRIDSCNKVSKICDYGGTSMNYHDGWIYMVCLKTTYEELGCEIIKVSIDGKEYKKIDIPGENTYIENMVIVDDKIYYTDNGLYCMNLEGDKIKKVQDNISDREVMWLLISDKVIESKIPNGLDEYTFLYKDFFQENEKWVYRYKWVEEDYHNGPPTGANLKFSNNIQIQWYPRDLYCIRHDYSEELLIDSNITAYNIDDEFIYYIKDEDEKTSSVWRADLDGSNKVKINEIVTEEDTWGYSISVSDNVLLCQMIHWIEDAYTYPIYAYIVNTDGSGVMYFEDVIEEK